ncbi:alpha-1,2-fucosyltransferase [Selenomonas sp. AE3005]|uniref:alpha-1,2-fucosyltransferase n=1 Tax=Selenomonas sp. AE3005 TaxID=1485543 RepID=UPI0026003141|nr:alpha-1,2-fucosyltransferase [Selenomonas sp. AE3005]
MKNKCQLEYDMSYFSEKNARVFVLDNFETVGKVTNKMWVKVYQHLPFGRKLYEKLLPIFYEKGSWFHEDVKNIRKKDAWLEGYWASPKYFAEIKDVLLNDFTCKVKLSPNTVAWQNKIINDSLPTVSIHIRRGDYVNSVINQQIFKALPLSYYYCCLNELRKKFGNLSIYVFSNDMEWVQENMDFDDAHVQFVTGNDEDHGFEDMILMWNCDHHIIANSTFSWWGAYLASGAGEVYAPNDWYLCKGDAYDIRDLYPDEWKIVRVD